MKATSKLAHKAHRGLSYRMASSSISVKEETHKKDGTFEFDNVSNTRPKTLEINDGLIDSFLNNPIKAKEFADSLAPSDLDKMDRLHMLSPAEECDWFFADNGEVFVRSLSVRMGPPFIGFSLTSDHWDTTLNDCPVLFASVYGPGSKSGAVHPKEEHMKLRSLQDAETAAYKASPEISAFYLGGQIVLEKGEDPRKVSYFTARTSDFLRAVVFYNSANGNTSKALNYLESTVRDMKSAVFMVKFIAPKYPLYDKPIKIVKEMAKLKLCLYCREYVSYMEM